jgi:Ribosomal protein S1
MTSKTTVGPKQIAINDIGSADDFLAAVEKTLKFFNDGDLIEGTVVKIDRDEVLLDVGYKTEGVIPSRELSIKHDVDPSEVVSVGDAIEALVLQKEDKEGRLILSKKRAQYERAWGDVEKIKETDGVVTGMVIEVVKGGLIVDIGLRGFLPASLIELRRVRDLSPYLGQEIEAKILELDKNRNNVVLSRRALLEASQSENRSSFLENLAKGQVRKGVVSSIVNFGAFVDLGGVMVWSTCPSSAGSTSSTPARSWRSDRKSRSRFSKLTWTASVCLCLSRRRRKTPGKSLPARTQSVRLLRVR